MKSAKKFTVNGEKKENVELRFVVKLFVTPSHRNPVVKLIQIKVHRNVCMKCYESFSICNDTTSVPAGMSLANTNEGSDDLTFN